MNIVNLNKKHLTSYDTTYNLHLYYFRLGKEYHSICREYVTSYDECLASIARNASSRAGCQILGAENVMADGPGCSNFTEELATVKSYMRSALEETHDGKRCKMPCEFIESDLQVADVQQSKSKMSKPGSPVSTVTLTMPSFIIAFETFNTYDFISLVADVANWFDLMFGICLIELNIFLFEVAAKLIKGKTGLRLFNQLRKVTLIIVGLFCFGCVLWQLIVCSLKFLSKDPGTSVAYKAYSSLQAPEFTFCHLLYFQRFLKQYYIERQAWNEDTTSLIQENIVNDIQAYNDVEHKWEEIWNHTNLAIDDVFLSPKYSSKLFYMCQKVHLQSLPFNRLRFNFSQNVGIYFFIHNKNHHFANIPSAYVKLKREQQRISYKMNWDHYSILPSKEYACNQQENDYDQCVESQAKQHMLKLFGCIAPVFYRATDICQSEKNATKSLQVTRKI